MLASFCFRERGFCPFCSEAGEDMDSGKLRYNPKPAKRRIADCSQKSGLCSHELAITPHEQIETIRSKGKDFTHPITGCNTP